MKKIDALTEEFKFKYEKFINACDSFEEIDKWDKDENGEMDIFYENDLISIILRLVAADGEISDKEVEYLNKSFGFDYTAESLKEAYENCREEIGAPFDEMFKKGVELLRSVSEKLADLYLELLGIICDIIILSDGFIAQSEIETAKKVKELF